MGITAIMGGIKNSCHIQMTHLCKKGPHPKKIQNVKNQLRVLAFQKRKARITFYSVLEEPGAFGQRTRGFRSPSTVVRVW